MYILSIYVIHSHAGLKYYPLMDVLNIDYDEYVLLNVLSNIFSHLKRNI